MEPTSAHSIFRIEPPAVNLNTRTSGPEPARAVENEREIIRRCLSGDMAAFRILYETHKDVLYNVAFRMHRNEQDAEDSVQETFVRIHESLGAFRGECRFSTWIYRILMNTCLTKIRRRRPSIESLDGSNPWRAEPPAEGNGNVTAKMILEQEIADLPPGFRAVFVLFEVEGFSHEEIGRMLDITEGTSKSQLHKAKRVLQKRLMPFMEILEAQR
jgi:RNA polymerase sigma-70 factor, ECF subfamily